MGARSSAKLTVVVSCALSWASAFGAACLPPDHAIERGAVIIELSAAAKTVEVSGFELVFDRITMVAGADLVDCHSVFYVERPPGPLAVFDVFASYTFELRSITEPECVAAGGFIVNNAVPVVAPGVSDAELSVLRRGSADGTLKSGSAHVVAELRYRGWAGEESTYRRRFDLTVHGMANAKTTLAKVPRGDKTDIRFTLDTQRVGAALSAIAGWDTNGDGIITNEELPVPAAEAFKNELGDSWTLTPRTSP